MSFESADIIIEEFTLTKGEKTFPLTPEQILSFEIFEAITAPFVTARFILTHSKGLEEFLPITGDEIIELNFRSKAKNTPPLKKFRFKVFAGREETIGSDRSNYQRTYRLFVADERFINSIDKEYSRSFIEQNVSKIVQHIAEKMIGVEMGFVEETIHDVSYVMPYVTPHQAIIDVAQDASSTSYNDGGFLFFQSTDIGFQFRSLSSLFQQPVTLRLIPNSANPFYEGNLIRWERLADFDILRAVRERTIGFTMLGWNINTKGIVKQEVSFDKFFENTVTLGTVAPLSSSQLNTQSIMLKYGGSDKWFSVSGRSRMKKSTIKQSRMKCHLKGTTKLAAGQVVNFYVDSQDLKEQENQKLTGKYLIESINHIWNNSQYFQVMTIIRDSYATLTDENLVRTTKNVGVG